MQITVEQVPEHAALSVIELAGALDATNYERVIERARELYAAGTRYVLIDMRGVTFLSSAGLVALHSIALLMRGEQPPRPEEGWAALHAFANDRESGIQPYVKLLGPQPKVSRSLQITGMDAFFEIHHEREAALASFDQ